MGFVQIPDKAHVGLNRAVLHLDHQELAHTINRLQSLLQNLPPSLPLLPPPSPIPPVHVLTPSVAALQHKLGLDLGHSLGLGSANGSSSFDSAALLSQGFQTASSTPYVGAPRVAIGPIQPRAPELPVSIATHMSSQVVSPSKVSQLSQQVRSHLPSSVGPGQVGNHGSSSAQSIETAMSGMHLQGLSDPSLLRRQLSDSEMQVVNPNAAGPNKLWGFSSASSKLQSVDDPRLVGRGALGPETVAPVPKSGSELRGPTQSGYSWVNLDSKNSQAGGPVTHLGGGVGGSGSMDSRGQQQVAVRAPSFVTAQDAISRSVAKGPANSIGQATGGQGEGYSGVGTLLRVPEQLSAWKWRWTTAAAEHNKEKITAMVYSQALEELSGGEDHSGWLITASRKLLNLWQGAAHSRSSEASLQLMHSQSTEFVMEDIDIDTSAKTLLGFCAHPRDAGFCVSFHSLAGETFLKYKGMIRIPDRGFSALRKQTQGSMRLLHVVSLQPLGGPLRSSLATAIGGEVLVYELSVASLNASGAASPKAVWKAHDAPISCLHRSNFACALFTGGSDGYIRLWDLKCKPTAPVRQFAQKNPITGIATLDANMVSSCSVDGVIQLWDIRSSNAAMISVIPDGKPILNMAAIPLENTISFTTRMGLYSLELANLMNSGPVLSPFTPLPPAGPCTDMKWNTKTREVYVSGIDGAVTVFGKS